MAERRVAITGMGVLAPCGTGRDAFWEGLLAPAPSGERRIHDFDPAPWFDNPKEARRADRFTQFALAAAAMAVEEAGAIDADPDRYGVLIGTGVGGLHSLEEQIHVYHEKGAKRVSPFLVPMMMGNAAAAAVSMRYGARGPCETTVTACAAGAQSIGNARRLITSGRCDVVLAGGSEAGMTPVGIAAFSNMTALSRANISRPFDAERDGFVMAEGAAVFVLEELGHARSRGARILGELAGAASTADAHHITAPAPGGRGAIRCMELALEDAGLTPGDIAHINAHGTSTPLNDAAEASAIDAVFGQPTPPVTSTKGVTGHLLGAAGPIELAAVLLTMEHGVIPPTAGFATADPALPPLDIVVGEPRQWTPGPVLSNSFGFGGHNATLAITPPPASA